jgi:excisionase family DNA binding protein
MVATFSGIALPLSADASKEPRRVLSHPAGAYTETQGETMQVNGTRMLRVKAVADMFDVSVATIYRAVEARKLDALRIGSRKGALRIPESALAAYAEECAEAAYQAFVVDGESAASADTDAGQMAAEVVGEVL